MLYACTSCGKEREIRVQDAWPDGCDQCGGTVWTSAPPEPFRRFGTLDASAAANALLRQPGSPLNALRHTGATATPI